MEMEMGITKHETNPFPHSVTIASVIRMVLLVQGLFTPLQSIDPDGNVGFTTSAIETNLALITASAPALRPLLRAWFPRLFGGVDRDQVEGATARRVLGGGTSAATSTTRTKLTRAKSLSQQPIKTQTRCERASNHGGGGGGNHTHNNKSSSSGSGSSTSKHMAELGAFDDDMMEALPFAALPFNGIIRRSEVHVLYEPNPAVSAPAAVRSPSEERRRFDGFV